MENYTNHQLRLANLFRQLCAIVKQAINYDIEKSLEWPLTLASYTTDEELNKVKAIFIKFLDNNADELSFTNVNLKEWKKQIGRLSVKYGQLSHNAINILNEEIDSVERLMSNLS
jgi:hypothetical protein